MSNIEFYSLLLAGFFLTVIITVLIAIYFGERKNGHF